MNNINFNKNKNNVPNNNNNKIDNQTNNLILNGNLLLNDKIKLPNAQ